MITLGSGLDTRLANKSSEASWCLKIFFNDDDDPTNFIGVSDKTRRIGTTTYHGIATWGAMNHAANLVSF